MARHHVGSSTLAQRAPRSISSEEISDFLRTIVEQGYGRTASRVRSLLHAAYARAISSRLNPAALSTLTRFATVTNPVSKVSALSEYNRTRARSLNRTELGVLWRALNPPGVMEAGLHIRFLRVTLMLGGQRCDQLVRVKLKDLDLHASLITLYDFKGRRLQPRVHVLPLTKQCRAEVEWLVQHACDVGSEYLFPSRNLKTTLNGAGITKSVSKLSRALLQQHAIPPFRYGDIRRTTETLLAQLRVPQEVRAHILSHGLGGIQERNYNRHEFLVEKMEALEEWNALLASFIEVR